MPIDKNASHYEHGNGRFDIMTDGEVKSLTCDDIMLIGMALSIVEKDNDPTSSLYTLDHQLYELRCRFPGIDFHLVPDGY